ncbi:ATPase, T2SS/T4P/T4SS family [Armatimonas sp.]|uniref:ATPase, T2SS/T4P/T4SS family n=1 Tax=Armatimonas sp. TaxID=1872638 RepID=UPI0037531A30
MKILAVEEDALSALLLHEALERQGHQATIVRDGEAAWEQLTQGSNSRGETRTQSVYNVLITRWNAPKVNGLDICRRIRHPDIGIENLPVLMAMDSDTPENRQRSLEAGAVSCVRYPLDVEEIRTALQDFSTLPPAEKIHNFATAPAEALALARVGGSTLAETNGTTLTTSSPPIPATGAGLPAVLPSTGTLGAKERLGEILITRGLISHGQLAQALEIQSLTRERLGSILVSKGWVNEQDITAAHSRQIDMTFVNVESESIYEDGIAHIPREQALALLVLPLEPSDDDAYLSDPPIRAAVANPWNTPAIDLVQARTKRRVKAVLAESTALKRAIELAYQTSSRSYEKTQLSRSLEATLTILNDDATLSPAETRRLAEDADNIATMDDPNDAPIVKFVNTILIEAVRRRASDVHIEPYKKDFQVRYRIDGHLNVMHVLPKTSFAALSSRIKILSDLDIAERRLPQDGRINLSIDGRTIQFRVSTLPNLYGERVVLRVLDGGATQKNVEQLEFSKPNLEAFHSLIKRPYGIILVTGPTGSGKTTTLYAALNAVKDPATNIMTCEDPVEYEMDRISQSMVNPKAGLTFASQLRAILRQDPDVVLVGEIRDGETAEIAFKAAMTGHLVLSTLHCNSAAGASMRLMDMGVEPFLIASGLIGALAQRLSRRLCTNCRTYAPPTPEQQTLLNLMYGAPLPVKAIGQPGACVRCNNTGTAGRLGIHELMVMSEPIQQLIMKRATTAVIQNEAMRQGMIPMIGDGLGKVIAGMALLDDIEKKVFAG